MRSYKKSAIVIWYIFTRRGLELLQQTTSKIKVTTITGFISWIVEFRTLQKPVVQSWNIKIQFLSRSFKSQKFGNYGEKKSRPILMNKIIGSSLHRQTFFSLPLFAKRRKVSNVFYIQTLWWARIVGRQIFDFAFTSNKKTLPIVSRSVFKVYLITLSSCFRWV